MNRGIIDSRADRSLVNLFGIRPGCNLRLIDVPIEIKTALKNVHVPLSIYPKAHAPFDMIIQFMSSSELRDEIGAAAQQMLVPGGVFWICGSAQRITDPVIARLTEQLRAIQFTYRTEKKFMGTYCGVKFVVQK